MGRKLIKFISITIIILIASTLTILYSQQGNTVFAKIITGATSGNAVQLVPSKYMVGQPFHIATAIFSSRTGQTCNSAINSSTLTIPSLTILASYDGVVFTDITNYSRVITPNQSVPASNSYRMMSSASGAFPFIELNVANWNSANCKVDVFYSGTISSLDIKKYADFGTANDTLQTFPFSTNSAGVFDLVSGGVTTRTVVYGLVIYNQTSQNLTLQETRTDAAVVQLMRLTGFPTGGMLSIENSNFPMFATSPGGTLQLVLQNATNVSGVVVFRSE